MTYAKKIINSSLVLLLMRLAMRGLGVISMLCLARILTPEDFGLIAIVSTFVFLFDILSEAGSQQYIIQKENIREDDLNTAWTVNIILKMLCWMVFTVLVPLITEFIEKPELALPLYVTSSILIISGFNNPGMFLHQKELNFRPQFKVSIGAKVISFIITLTIALIYTSYWAMVIGIISTYLTTLIGSYVFHPYRPKVSLKECKEQWNFSKWMLFRGAIGYVRSEVDTIFTSKLFDTGTVGGYNMMKNLTMIPAQDIIKPATQPLLSSFSKVKSEAGSLLFQLNLSLIVIIILSSFMTVFCFFNAELLVTVLLGEKWGEFSKVFQYMSLFILTFSVISIFMQAITAINKIKWLFIYDLLSMLIVVITFLIFTFNNVAEFAITRVAIAILTTFAMLLFCGTYFKLNIFRVFLIVLPFVSFALCSAFTTETLLTYLSITNQYIYFIAAPAFYLIFFVFLSLITLPWLSKTTEVGYLVELTKKYLRSYLKVSKEQNGEQRV